MTASVVAAYALAAAVTARMAWSNWRHRRDSPTYAVIAFMGAGVSLQNLLGGLLLLAPGEAVAWALVAVQNVASPIVMGSVPCMALALADRAWRVSRRLVLLLSVEPAVLLVLVATNPWHRLLIPRLEPGGLNGSLLPVLGPLVWISTGYVLFLSAWTVFRVLKLRRRSTSRAQRRLCARILVTFLPPVVVMLLAPLLPFRLADAICLGQAITMVYIQLALTGVLPRQLPVAHEQVFSAITDAVTVVDRAGRITDANPAARMLYRRLVPDLPPDVSDDLTGLHIDRLFDLQRDERSPGELVVTGLAGGGLDLHLLVNPLVDRRRNCIGWALVARDITESNRRRREAEDAARELSEKVEMIEALRANLAERVSRDDLTGLRNRRHLMEILRREAPGGSAGDGGDHGMMSLAIIDLDHFKNVNDTYGHAAGDQVLIAIAHQLAGAVRAHDVVARYGGEEFVILFRGARAEAAWARTQALLERLRRTRIDVEGHALSVSFSAGVSELAPGESYEDLLRTADTALYQAKRQGRDRVVLATAPARTASGGSAPGVQVWSEDTQP